MKCLVSIHSNHLNALFQLTLDTGVIDFGTTVIGETVKRTFVLTNRGALGTKFDFFKVTGMKQRTLTTAGTSLGRLVSDLHRASIYCLQGDRHEAMYIDHRRDFAR